jgi:hypothetical protein
LRPPPDDFRLAFRLPDDFEALFFRPPPDELRLVDPDLALAPPPLVRLAPADTPPPVPELMDRVPPEVDVDPPPNPPVRAAPVVAGVLLPP